MTILSYLRSIFADDGAAYITTAKITAADRDAAHRFAGDEHWLVERYAGMLAEYREEVTARCAAIARDRKALWLREHEASPTPNSDCSFSLYEECEDIEAAIQTIGATHDHR